MIRHCARSWVVREVPREGISASCGPEPTRLRVGWQGPGLLAAHVLISKYADHLPLYRQCEIYERQEWNWNGSDPGGVGRGLQ